LTAFNRSGLQYMLTGALAASYYGRSRTTLDVDVVVVAKQDDLARLGRALSRARLNVREEDLLASWQSQYRIATIEDKRSPHTLDIIFADGELERNAGRVLGVPTYYQTDESLILAKLRMIKVTLQAERAETDRQDIKAILETQRVNLGSLRRRARAESTTGILDDLIPNARLRALKGKYKGRLKRRRNTLEEKGERFVNEGRR